MYLIYQVVEEHHSLPVYGFTECKNLNLKVVPNKI